jgi:hypothetical protein
MSDYGKDNIIQMIIFVISAIATFLLNSFFKSKGFFNFSNYCLFILFTPVGLYNIFGKKVYFR